MKALNAASIILTEECNLACSYCYEKRKSPETMTEDTAIKAVDFISEHQDGTSRPGIIWFGGEPLLNFAVLKAASDYAKNKIPNLDQLLITNGTIMDDEIFDFFSSRPWIRVQLSWDGMPKYQDTCRGMSPVFEESLKRWVTTGNPLDIHVQVTPEMAEGLLENIDYVNEKAPKAKIVLRPVGELSWDESTVNKLMQSAHAVFEKYGELIDKVSNCESALQSTGICAAGKTFGSVAPNGDIYACHRFYFAKNRNFKMGSIHEGFSDSPRAEIIMECARDNIAGCLECDAYENCDRCLACNFSETGDILIPCVSACEVSKAMFFALLEYNKKHRPWMLEPLPKNLQQYYPVAQKTKDLISIFNGEVIRKFMELDYRVAYLEESLRLERLKSEYYKNKR